MKITEVKPVICQGGIRWTKIKTDKGIIGWETQLEWVGEITCFSVKELSKINN